MIVIESYCEHKEQSVTGVKLQNMLGCSVWTYWDGDRWEAWMQEDGVIGVSSVSRQDALRQAKRHIRGIYNQGGE